MKESQQLRQFKDSFGYINCATYNEMIKGFDIQYEAYKENFKDEMANNQMEKDFSPRKK